MAHADRALHGEMPRNSGGCQARIVAGVTYHAVMGDAKAPSSRGRIARRVRVRDAVRRVSAWAGRLTDCWVRSGRTQFRKACDSETGSLDGKPPSAK